MNTRHQRWYKASKASYNFGFYSREKEKKETIKEFNASQSYLCFCFLLRSSWATEAQVSASFTASLSFLKRSFSGYFLSSASSSITRNSIKSVKINKKCPDWCDSVGWVSSHKLKSYWFNFQSGHTPGLWAGSPVRGLFRGNWSIFLSHIGVFLSFSLPYPLPKNK